MDVILKRNLKMVHSSDISDLRRMATNFYDNDKALINRVLRGISELTTENGRLKSELEKLKAVK